MPRRSSGRSAPRPAPRAAPRAAPRPVPVRQSPPPAQVPAQGGGSLLGGIGSAIAQYMALGTGLVMADRAVDAVVGPRTIRHENVPSEAPASGAPAMNNSMGNDSCGIHSKAFQDCVNNFGIDISRCQFYLDKLTECRRGSGASTLA